MLLFGDLDSFRLQGEMANLRSSKRFLKQCEPKITASAYYESDPDWVERRFVSTQKGDGLFATKILPTGSFVICYRGKRLTKTEYKDRLDVSYHQCLK